MAGGRKADAPAAAVAHGSHRPAAFGASGDPVERRADDAVPAQASGPAPPSRVDLRRERLDGALLATADDLRPRDRAPRRPGGVRFLDALDEDHANDPPARPGPGT